MLKRELSNKLFLLRLIDLSDSVCGLTRLQKLVFATEVETRKLGSTKTFNYKFIRWHYGPFSRELTDDIKELVHQGLVKVEGNNIYSLTEKGKLTMKKSLSIISHVFEEEMMISTIEEYNSKTLKSLLSDVYDKHNITNYKMGEIIEDIKYSEESTQ